MDAETTREAMTGESQRDQIGAPLGPESGREDPTSNSPSPKDEVEIDRERDPWPRRSRPNRDNPPTTTNGPKWDTKGAESHRGLHGVGLSTSPKPSTAKKKWIQRVG